MRGLLVLVGLLALVPPAAAGQAEDAAAIRELVAEGFAALNRHDPKAYVALYAEDYENWTGVRKGRAALEDLYTTIWERQTDRQYELLEELGLIFVTPDVAILKARTQTSGRLDRNGRPLPSLTRLVAWVLARNDGTWQYQAIFQRPIRDGAN